MKHILLLLIFNSICLAQETKVTAYRLIDEGIHGSCSVKMYVEEYRELGFKGFSWYVTVESQDEKLAKKLLAIKREAKRWREVAHNCGSKYGMIGGDMVHNMIEIEIEGLKDTLFSTVDNNRIVFPEINKAYIDEKSVFKKSLTGIIKEFFEFDFTKDIKGMRMIDFPTEEPESALFNDENLEGFTKDKFEKQFGRLKPIGEKDNYGTKEFIYSFKEDIYTFENDEKLVEIEVLNPNSGWAINGLQIGSRQESFEDKYPESMSFNVICSEKFEDYKSEQLHWLLFKEDKGSVSFWIKDGVLDRFIVDYY